ncbi:D-alanyl-D-alanine carboxypeptidase [Streptomyces sp. 6-11-2]|uniref:D-alanyl-D-alanine carboxypeptidase n=1 Tax=Streptomyces sp. 6-11-2 TaxID=2585753 RepID=UPI0011417887|nr:D-alanyl-D-alanine carboxypeptidase [Streptomyces sp. 6-11-2]GED86389.1 D-alanyl-D-alanine carboxypeptidase [Streptomyces sp. 6-11-2]
MAGESPDRSKQRESSAQKTSGSAGPVPESRNEARDPRLALTGESGESAESREPGSSGGSEGRGGVDTATRVLSTRDVRTTARTGAADDADGTDDPADTAGAAAESDGDGAGAAGDARLRAAVAAWVDSGDDDKRADTENASGDGTGAKDAGTEGGIEAEASEDASGGAAAASGKAGAESGTAGEAEAASDARDAEAEDADDAEPTKARVAPEGDADGPEAASDARDAEAEDADDAEPTKAPVAPEADADGPEDAARGKAGTEPEAADDAAVGASDAEAADEAGDAKRAEAEAAPGAAGRAKDGVEPEADAEGPDDADGAKRDGQGKGSGDGKRAEADEAAEDDDPGAGDGGSEGVASDEKPPVDQPTTMLKIGGAAKPQVDQPTTMLKLGGDKKRAPESEAERTSKFVALKPLDSPQPRKPRPAQPDTPTSKPVPAAAVPQVGPERTTQQPLPPKPPLDLLAELTNTPPPPETPLRTTVRRLKIWTPLVVLLLIVFAIVQAVRPLPDPTFALTAEDTYTFPGEQVKLPWPDEGQGWMGVDGVGTMDHFGEQKPVAIGSVAKTMTAYIILRDHPLKAGEEGPKIEIDPTAEKEGGYDKAGESTLNTMKAGDFLTEKQALSAVMIPSANNIARLLARWDAGSEAEFVKKMNATAKELGMANTTYTDPSGLKETTVSTAEDQVKLGNAAMTMPAMVAITSAASWTDPTGKYWNNYNELPYTIGAIGIKTGSTTAAGGNLLFAAQKQVGGRTVTIVGAILGQHKREILATVNAVSKTALLAAKDVPTSAKILKKGDVVGYVDDQLGGHTPVVVTKDVTAVGWAGLRLELSLSTDVLPHTAKAGTEVGMLTVGDGGDGAVQVPVALQDDLAEPGFPARLTRIG